MDLFPMDTKQIKDIFAEFNNNREKIAIRGLNSKSPPLFTSKIISQGWNRVIEYNPTDFLITVESGIEIEELNYITRKNGQTILIDSFFLPFGTIGGRLSMPFYTPLELNYGLKENFVNRLNIIAPNGMEYVFGATTLKNVAGYSLEKYLMGRMGRLGYINSITLRTFPLIKKEKLYIIKDSEYTDILPIASIKKIFIENSGGKSQGKWIIVFGDLDIKEKRELEVYDISDVDNISKLSGFFGYEPCYVGTIYIEDKEHLEEIKNFVKKNSLIIVYRENFHFIHLYKQKNKNSIELSNLEVFITHDPLYRSVKKQMDPFNILL